MLEADIRSQLASKIDETTDEVVLSDVTDENGVNIKMTITPAKLAELSEAGGYDEETSGHKAFWDECRAEELIT